MGFEAPTLLKDVDSLINFSERKNMLGYNLILDLTYTRGGSRGAYVVQRLSPLPFKTTFGNLRLSDITLPFIEDMNKEYSDVNSSGIETIDNGSNLLEWLNNDVKKGLAAGQLYSNNVPFKLAHLPKYSDGIINPAPKHFTGKMVCFMGPWGGSHLDQFSSIVSDNNLAYTIGMPTGGFSNTWEWTETLKFPNSRTPLVSFMWSIGHTIRPNGEVLEGNPAQMKDYVPVTRDNFLTYYEILFKKAYEYLK